MPVKAIPKGYENVIPYMVCKDTDKVIEFCRIAFGAKVDEINRHEDGKVAHATIHIRDSAVMFSEGSETHPPSPSMVYIYVDNVDSVYKKAIEAGAESLREPTNEFYGDRSCGLKDVSGNQWWIASHVEDVTPEEMERRMKETKK